MTTLKKAEVKYKPSANDVYDEITVSHKNKELGTFKYYIADKTANYFVNPETGNDKTGTGVTMEEAFKTLNKALSKVANGKTSIYVKGKITNEDECSFNQSLNLEIYCTKDSSIQKGDNYILKIGKCSVSFKNKDGRVTTYENNSDSTMHILNSN